MNFKFIILVVLVENIFGFNMIVPKVFRFFKNRFTKIDEIKNSENKGVKRIVNAQDPNNKNIYQFKPVDKYNLGWYVVAQSNEFNINFNKNKPRKITVLGKNYAIWKDSSGKYSGIDDECPHRGASLSCGKIDQKHNAVICPYHAFKYSGKGELCAVPGQTTFLPSINHDVQRYSVVEKHGWIYLNTNAVPADYPDDKLTELNSNIFLEPEAEKGQNMSVLYLNTDFNAYPRIVTENSLDVMHIGFVHTFGNAKQPAPTYEIPPHIIGMFHCRASYGYASGENSMVKKMFGIDNIDIDNEFILPHTTIARVKFGDGLINTIVTAACPISDGKTRLFVKTYRNFMNGTLEDELFKKMMFQTLMEDKKIIETILPEHMDGKFNMKYDKLQNTYKTYYKTFVRNDSTVRK